MINRIMKNTLEEIGARLRTQDNRCTASPMFIVQQQRFHTCDPAEADEVAWFDNEGNQQDDETCARLDKLDDELSFSALKNPELEEYTKRGIIHYWEFCMAAFTEEGCKEYLRLNGHNLHEPRIYADSWHRCPEMLTIREYLMQLPPPIPL